MVMMSTQARIAYIRQISIGGWLVTRRRQYETRDEIHDTLISTTDDDAQYKSFIGEVSQNHTFVQQGFLKQGDAIGNFLLEADLDQKDEIIDTNTGKTYEIVSIWLAVAENNIQIGKKVALRWLNRTNPD